MKIVAWSVGVLLAAVLVFAGVERYAAESREVVVMHANDPEGSAVSTRLWVVDHDDAMWLRTGADGSGWYTRLQANDTIEIERDGRRVRYTAAPEPAVSEVVNRLMLEKYGWRDRFIGWMVGGREGSIPIRLTPLP